MSEQKILSVIVAAYNVEHFLRECLNSLLHTKQANDTQVIIVDDGSKDKTGQLADWYALKYPNIIKVIHKENGGHGSAINVGIEHAVGKYFKIVDGDDKVNSKAYDQYLKRLKTIESDLIATPFLCAVYKKNKRIKIKKRKIEGAEHIKNGYVTSFKKISNQVYICMHQWTIRTKLLKQHDIKLLEHSFYVDMQYILFPIPWIKTVCILDMPVYIYRLGLENQSVSVKNMKKNRIQHQKVIKTLTDFYRERNSAGDKKEVLAYLAKGIARMEINQVQIALSLPYSKKAKQELIFAEKRLKKNCPAAYAANTRISILLLRKTNYFLYPVATILWRIIK